MSIGIVIAGVEWKQVPSHAVEAGRADAGCRGGQGVRLIDWMLDERLPGALEAISTGRIDPVALNEQRALDFRGW